MAIGRSPHSHGSWPELLKPPSGRGNGLALAGFMRGPPCGSYISTNPNMTTSYSFTAPLSLAAATGTMLSLASSSCDKSCDATTEYTCAKNYMLGNLRLARGKLQIDPS